MKKIVGWLVIIFLLTVPTVRASELSVGTVKTVKGTVSLFRNNQILPIHEGDKIFKDDGLRTGRESSLGMVFKDDTLLSLGPNSEIIVKEFLFSPGEGKLSWVARLVKGTAACLTGIIAKLSPQSVRFETPVAHVGIRGTRFAVQVQEDKEGGHENQ